MILEIKRYVSEHPIILFIIGAAWLVNVSLIFPLKAQLGHDTFWHLSLISVAFDTFPPQVPIFSGSELTGYNYLLDLIIYLITRVGFSPMLGYLVVLPFIYLLTTTLLGLGFAIRYNKSIQFVGSFMFLLFFASPFSYIMSFIHRGSFFFGFQYPTTMQSVTALTNLAHALTVPLLLAVLIILFERVITWRRALLLGLLVSVAFGLKFYGGVVIGFLVLLFMLSKLIQEKNIRQFITYSFIIGIPSLLTIFFFYDPLSSSQSGSIFILSPLSTVHPLIEDPDSFYLPTLVLARYSLVDAGGFSLRLLAIELFTITLYVIYNAGTRIIGFISLFRKIITKHITTFDFIVLIAMCGSGALSILLIQKGGDWWNTVQFFAYSLLFLNIYAADSLVSLLNRKNIITSGIFCVIIILTAPLSIEMVMRSIQAMDKQNGISVAEQEALAFLKEQDEGVVFTIPIQYKSAYVSALSEKPAYYADENVLTNIGVDYEERKKEISNLEKIDYAKLNATYIYYLTVRPQGETYNVDTIRNELLNNSYKVIFSNEEVIIYKR